MGSVWPGLLLPPDYSAFEDAFEATYNGSASGDASRTLQQYDEMVEWLVQSPSLAYMQIHELHNYAVRELVYDAVQLAKKPFNETAALTVLEYISTRLAQVRTHGSCRLGRSRVQLAWVMQWLSSVWGGATAATMSSPVYALLLTGAEIGLLICLGLQQARGSTRHRQR